MGVKYEAAGYEYTDGTPFILVWATDENGDRREIAELLPEDVVGLARQLLRWAPGQGD